VGPSIRVYAPAVKNRITGELCVCGYNAVAALCAVHPERVRRLFFSAERSSSFGAACKALAAARRPYRIVEDGELERLAKSVRHQGVVAMCDPAPVPEAGAADVARWADSGERVAVIEDVGNDHNLGAIARSAAFFGIRTILLSGADGASLSTAAYRVAEGGMEYIDFFSTRDPGGLFRPSGAFTLIGADSRGNIAFDDPKAFPEGKSGWGIVLGNELSGLTSGMRSLCARSVRIPGLGNVESLNVAQAAAVLFSRMRTVERKP
jgi:RNA methyltransferase, TrmH family